MNHGRRNAKTTGLATIIGGKPLGYHVEYVSDSTDALFAEEKVRSPKFRLGKRIF